MVSASNPDSDAPCDLDSTAASRPRAAILLAFVLGGVLGGAGVYALGPRRPAAPASDELVERVRASVDELGARLESRLDERLAAAFPHPSPAREIAGAPRPPEGTAAGAEPPPEPVASPPRDTSPAALAAELGGAVVSLIGFDEEGDARPRAPAAAIAANRILAPFSAIEGTVRAVARDGDRRSHEVTGVLAYDATFDLVLLEVAPPLSPPHLSITGDAPSGSAELILLGPADDEAWRETVIHAEPGGLDRFSGGPRFRLETTPKFAGVAIDAEGRVVAVLPEPSDLALIAHVARPWPAADAAAVSLDAFRRTLGPGSPSTRMKDARKLIAQRRYDEAARLLLVVTVEEPRLLDDARDDLVLSTVEAARGRITTGQGHAAALLVGETLQRLPDVAELWAIRGRGLALAGDVRLAIASFVRAIELEPAREGEWRPEARGVLMDEVNRLHAAGLTSAALSLLLEERSGFPIDGRLRFTAGELLMTTRQFEPAARLFDEAAVIDASIAAEARQAAKRARDLAGGRGAIVIDFAPGSSPIVVDARFNGQSAARLRIDPSEERTVLPAFAAVGAGYALAAAPRVRFFVDPRRDEVPSIEVRTITVAGVTVDRVAAVVVDDYARPDADGVLGASFLSRFRLVEDRELGRLVLHPRR